MSMEPLAVLIGSWEIVGRSTGVDHDNIRRTSQVVPILSGHVLQPAGTMYARTISDDGTTIDGRWRPDAGQPAAPGPAYGAMTRRVG